MFLLVGLILLIAYYILFRWYILKFDIKVPGRDDKEEVALITKTDYQKNKQKSLTADNTENGANILKAIGGKENLVSIDNCFTRLRLELKNIDIINEELLKQTGSKGVVKRGNEIQIIYGTNVNTFRKMLEDYLDTLNEKTP